MEVPRHPTDRDEALSPELQEYQAKTRQRVAQRKQKQQDAVAAAELERQNEYQRGQDVDMKSFRRTTKARNTERFHEQFGLKPGQYHALIWSMSRMCCMVLNMYTSYPLRSLAKCCV